MLVEYIRVGVRPNQSSKHKDNKNEPDQRQHWISLQSLSGRMFKNAVRGISGLLEFALPVIAIGAVLAALRRRLLRCSRIGFWMRT